MTWLVLAILILILVVPGTKLPPTVYATDASTEGSLSAIYSLPHPSETQTVFTLSAAPSHFRVVEYRGHELPVSESWVMEKLKQQLSHKQPWHVTIALCVCAQSAHQQCLLERVVSLANVTSLSSRIWVVWGNVCSWGTSVTFWDVDKRHSNCLGRPEHLVFWSLTYLAIPRTWRANWWEMWRFSVYY